MKHMITCRQIKKADGTTSRAVGGLLAELSENAGKKYSPAVLARAVKEKNCFILGAYEEGTLIGMVTLTSYATVGGMCGRIEDVVVREVARGKGVGRELMRRSMKEAKRRKLRYVELTSNSKRITANKLYQSLGFALRETNAYRLLL